MPPKIHESMREVVHRKDKHSADLETLISMKSDEIEKTLKELKHSLDERDARIQSLKRVLEKRDTELYQLKTSTSWRITAPLREIGLRLKSLRRKRGLALIGGARGAKGRDQAEEPRPAVSVIVTAYNCAETIETCLDSLLAQSCEDMEIIVVDDASTDATFRILDQYRERNPNICLIKNLKNMGTYWCKNVGLINARGEFVTFQDSDDTSTKGRIKKQLKALQKDPASIVATCNYVRVDGDGNVLNNRGLYERRALMAPMFRRDAFINELGFYDSVRTSADAELMHRLQRFVDKARIIHIDKPLYYALARDNSLTAGTVDLAKGDTTNGDPLDFLSPARQDYVRAYDAFHAKMKDEGVIPRYDFPLLRRPFAVPETLNCDLETNKPWHVTASLATMPSREESLEEVVSSMLPQVDELCVYLNNYEDIPDFLNHAKIRIARSQDHGDLRDNGKFFFAGDIKDGFHLVIDDDIIYPSDYVRRLVLRLIQYDYRVVVGVHGIRLAVPLKNFMGDRDVRCFWHAASNDEFMNLLGTGTVAYHTSTMDVSLDNFKTAGMADLWFAILAKKQGVPMISLQRDSDWLVQSSRVEVNGLYHEALESDDIHTKIIRENGPWDLNQLTRHYADFFEWLEQFSYREIVDFGLDPEIFPIKAVS